MFRVILLNAFLPAAILMSVSAAAGTISGQVTFKGEAPAMRPIQMQADPVCDMKHAEPPLTETLVLGKDNSMANVLVQVVTGLPEAEYPVPQEPLVLSQEGCRYSPRVFGLRAGQKLRVLNPDGTTHNVNFKCEVNRPLNLGMPKTLHETEVTFDQPEPVFPVKCDVHPWMLAYCAVLSHPYFAVTDADGRFELPDLPAGKYLIEAWHEKLGTQRSEIMLEADGTATADFVFERPGRS
jgi:plastocyanin